MKKAITILLILAMILSVFTGCGNNGGGDQSTNSETTITEKEKLVKQFREAFNESESFSGGTGTEDDPWLISTADDLFRLANQVNGERQGYVYREAHYLLTADIDLGGKDWMPIGMTETYSFGFWGVFDGDGYTVSGMRVICPADGVIRDAGLFGSVRGTVKNLTVAASELDTSKIEESVATGAVAGALESGGIIQNCQVAPDVIILGGYNTGGVVGNCNGMITDCTNEATVSGSSTVGSVGGIVGEFSGTPVIKPTNGIMRNCSNTGAVVSAGSNAGGVVGLMMGETELTGCTNTGSILSEKDAGGIAGEVYSSNATVTDCSNSGSIMGKESCGGIVGTTSGGSIMVLNHCANSGNVTAAKYMGGIVGMFMSSSQSMSLDIMGCSNSGDVCGGQETESANAGGVLGFAMAMGGNVNLENSTNTGNIDSGNGNSGGILGGYLSALGAENSTMTISINGCDNTGNVSGGSFGIGGIAGDIDASGFPAVDCRITGCSNSGSLYARGTNVLIGGIVGTIEPHHCVAFVSDCRNFGSLTCDKTVLDEGDLWFPFQAAIGGVVGYVGSSGISPDNEDNYGLGDQVVVTISSCSSTGIIDINDTDVPVCTDEICAMSAVGLEIR